jgi:hypothetical protein
MAWKPWKLLVGTQAAVPRTTADIARRQIVRDMGLRQLFADPR